MPGCNRDIRVRRMEDNMGSQGGSRTKKLKYEKAKEDWGASVMATQEGEQTNSTGERNIYFGGGAE